MRFHFNEIALKMIAQSRTPDREGRLIYRSSHGKYKPRWFRLQGNLLFYYKQTNEFSSSTTEPDPIGVFVLARYVVQTEVFSDLPFVFSLSCEGEEKHYFSGISMEQCSEWISALHNATHDILRMKYEILRQQIKSITGKDPITEKTLLPPEYLSKPKTVVDKSRGNTMFYKTPSPVNPQSCNEVKLAPQTANLLQPANFARNNNASVEPVLGISNTPVPGVQMRVRTPVVMNSKVDNVPVLVDVSVPVLLDISQPLPMDKTEKRAQTFQGWQTFED